MSENKVPWHKRVPKVGRFIIFSTFSVLLALAALIAGLLYIDSLKSGESNSSGLISEALGTMAGYSGERAFNGSERMNVLCLGIDYNRDSKGMGYTKGARSDTMFVISIDSKGRTLNVVSIPRDCYVYLGDDYGYDKINAAYMYGGLKLARKVVSEFLDIPIHHYVIIKVSGAAQLVDALGGLVIDVEKDMDYDDNWGNLHIHLKAGEQLLKGEQAVGYARFRMDAESDRGRIRRQQQVMASVIKRLKDPMAVLRLQSIVKAVKQNVETDFSLMDMLDLTYLYKDFDRRRMKTGVIVGDDSDIDGVSYIIPYAPMNEKTVLELLKDPSNLQRDDVRVEVLNGSSEEGLEGRVADYLTQEGFRVVNVGTSERRYEVTTVIDYLDSSAIRNGLENMLLGCSYEVSNVPYDKRKADITIIVGEDRVGAYDKDIKRSPTGYGSYEQYNTGLPQNGSQEKPADSAEEVPIEDVAPGGQNITGYPRVNKNGTVTDSNREFGAVDSGANSVDNGNNEPANGEQVEVEVEQQPQVPDYTIPQEQDEPAAPIEEQPEAPMPAPIEVAPEGDNGGENAPVPEAVDIEGGEEQNNLY